MHLQKYRIKGIFIVHNGKQYFKYIKQIYIELYTIYIYCLWGFKSFKINRFNCFCLRK